MALEKLKSDIGAAPVGALIGAVGGYMLARYLKYDKTISVVSFTLVGAIVIASLGIRMKNNK